jgi:hypoxanthine phosphoribosyltransferase
MKTQDWSLLYSQIDVEEAIRNLRLNIAGEVLGRIVGKIPGTLVLIAILKGGLWTAYQILHHLDNYVKDVRIGHMGISSYGNGRQPDQMKVTSTLDLSIEDVQDSNVWIIDDIWDTGATMMKAFEIISLMKPAHLRTAALVHKINTTGVAELGPTIAGFRYTGDKFLAGCGMGCGEMYRHLSEIYEVPDEK